MERQKIGEEAVEAAVEEEGLGNTNLEVTF